MTFDVEVCAQHHSRTGRGPEEETTKTNEREVKKSRRPYTYHHICIKERIRREGIG